MGLAVVLVGFWAVCGLSPRCVVRVPKPLVLGSLAEWGPLSQPHWRSQVRPGPSDRKNVCVVPAVGKNECVSFCELLFNLRCKPCDWTLNYVSGGESV